MSLWARLVSWRISYPNNREIPVCLSVSPVVCVDWPLNDSPGQWPVNPYRRQAESVDRSILSDCQIVFDRYKLIPTRPTAAGGILVIHTISGGYIPTIWRDIKAFDKISAGWNFARFKRKGYDFSQSPIVLRTPATKEFHFWPEDGVTNYRWNFTLNLPNSRAEGGRIDMTYTYNNQTTAKQSVSVFLGELIKKF